MADEWRLSHGVIAYWTAELLWDVAMAVGDGVACYGIDFESADPDVTPSRVRRVGTVGLEGTWDERPWARYEPDYGGAMYRLMFAQRRHDRVLAVPFGTGDGEALGFVRRVGEGDFWLRVVEAYSDEFRRGARRTAAIFGELSGPFRWCWLNSFVDEDGPDALLCADPVMRDAFGRAVEQAGKQVRYKW